MRRAPRAAPPRRRAGSTGRAGFTLVELLMGLGVAVVVVGAAMMLLVGGGRSFSSSLAALAGPDEALLLLGSLEEDLEACLQAPGDPRPPLRVTPTTTGPRLTFYRVDPERTNPNVVVGVPVAWDLVETEDEGEYHPRRNGKVLRGVRLLGWDLELQPPRAGEEKDGITPGWFLHVDIRMPARSLVGKPYRVQRMVFLPQPTSNFLRFTDFGEVLIEDVVKMVRRPEDDATFGGLGPPDRIEMAPGDPGIPGGEGSP